MLVGLIVKNKAYKNVKAAMPEPETDLNAASEALVNAPLDEGSSGDDVNE